MPKPASATFKSNYPRGSVHVEADAGLDEEIAFSLDAEGRVEMLFSFGIFAEIDAGGDEILGGFVGGHHGVARMYCGTAESERRASATRFSDRMRW